MPEDYRPPISQENLLLDLVQRLGRLRTGRMAAHIHLSELSKAYARERFLQIAADSFTSQISGFEGHLFILSNGDLFFIAKDVTATTLEATVSHIRLLFSLDPLLDQRTDHGESGFCTFYDVEKDYDKLLDLAERLVQTAEAARTKRPLSLISASPPNAPISPEILSRLEQSLENVDVTNITRRQTVCTLLDKKAPQPLFEEIFISIEDLQNVVTPGVSIGANPWLFRYLTQILDRRIMLMLIRDGIASTRPFSLNLNVDTILSPEFSRFETAITPQLKGRLVIEMNKLDIFSDMGTFIFARDYLHDHGFRLCLDGLTHHTLPFYNRSRLGFDLIKLFWAPNALETIQPAMVPEVRQLIMETGQAHTILCRCDDERAVQMGQELGIVMFQGRYVDRAMAAARLPTPSKY